LHQKKKNYLTAYSLATKLLEYVLDQEDEELAQKILKHCETKGRTNTIEIDFDERNPFSLCAHSFTPIYYGSPLETCFYCKASYLPDYSGKVCSICKIGKIGKIDVDELCQSDSRWQYAGRQVNVDVVF